MFQQREFKVRPHIPRGKQITFKGESNQTIQHIEG